MILPIKNHLPSYLPCLSSRHRHRSRRRPTLKKLLLLPAAGIILVCILCSSCTESGSGPPPSVPVTDTAPVGDGLKVIGYAMLGAAVVVVLGRMIR